MGRLVFPDRDEVRAVDDDVGGLQHGIAEESVGVEVLVDELLLLLLERRHALEPGDRRDHREKQVELGVFLDLRLDEDRRLFRVDSRGDPVGDRVERALLHAARIRVVGGQRVPVGDEIEAAVGILEADPVAHRAEIVAEVHSAGRPEAAENDRLLLGHRELPFESD